MFSQSKSPRPIRAAPDFGAYFTRYVAVIVKNVVGWMLMLSALAIGSFFPIPIGTPRFLIGFALITLPGKRRLTSGALRGKQIGLFSPKARMWRVAISLLLPPAAMWFLAFQRHPILHPSQLTFARLCAVYALAIAAAWFLTLMALLLLNAALKFLPRVRRKVRPWLREHGVNLLPPRRKPRSLATQQAPDDHEIVEFSHSHLFSRDRGEKS